MPQTCLVFGCKSRGNKDKVKFYVVPSVMESKYYPHLNTLSRERREKWISVINRSDLTPSILRNQKVCSKHFVSGRPSKLKDVNNPDWAPSQHLGGTYRQVTSKRKDDTEIKMEIDKRKKLSVSEQEEEMQSKSPDVDILNVEDRCHNCASQTDLTMETLTLSFQQLRSSPLGLIDDTADDEKWKFYTGFEYKCIQLIFEDIKPFISATSTPALTPFNQLLLTVVKLRLNLQFEDLAYRFQITPSTALTYFENTIKILYGRLKTLIIWPDRSVYGKNVPPCFREAFKENTSIIVDYFEVFVEKPDKYIQQDCWSSNRHDYTFKYLIGFTPQGTVCYISKACGGRTSNKQMVELHLYHYIKQGDVILTDGEFFTEGTQGDSAKILVIQAFTKEENELHPVETEEMRHLAEVRIHVGGIIGVIKSKFEVFRGPIPTSMLQKNNDCTNLLDKIVTVCCALFNLVKVVPFGPENH